MKLLNFRFILFCTIVVLTLSVQAQTSYGTCRSIVTYRGGNQLRFSIYVKNTTEDTIIFSVGSYYLNFNKAILNGGTGTLSICNSELPSIFFPRSPTVKTTTTPWQLWLLANTPQGINNGYKLGGGDSAMVVSLKLTTSAATLSSDPDSLALRTPPSQPYTSWTSYVNSQPLDLQHNCLFYDNSIKDIGIASPSGGAWETESMHNIVWQCQNLNKINLDYSADNGASWVGIVQNYPADSGYYKWSVPKLLSNSCLMRVTNSDNTSMSAVSSNNFSMIEPRKITLLSPAGDDTLKVADSDTIKWSSISVSNVRIEYSTNNGLDWILIASKIPAVNGNYLWTVPNILSTQCKIKISDYSNSTINSTGSGLFSIVQKVPPVPVLLYPVNGINLPVISVDLNWSSSSKPVSYLLQVASDSLFTTLVFSDSTITDTVKNIAPLQNNHKYFWRVRAKNTVGTSPYSNINSFIVDASPLVLLSPNGGEIFSIADTCIIRWSCINISNVKLEFSSDNGLNWNDIKGSTSAESLSYTWKAPNVLSKLCRVRISDSANSNLSAVSQDVFTVKQKFLKLLTPLNGSPNQILASVTFKWNAVPNAINYNIKVALDSSFLNIVADKTVPVPYTLIGSFQTASRYFWKVIAKNADSVSSYSDIWSFTTQGYGPLITILTPNGGDILRIGSVFDITWTTTFATKINLYYSTNGGTIWRTITSSWPSTSLSYSWLVPNTPTDQLKIKIGDSAVVAISAANSSISLSSAVQENEKKHSIYQLNQNYPNPFNPNTTIKYSIPNAGMVTLKVFDVLGKEVTTLVNEEKSAGSYSVNFNAANLPSGVYFYCLKSGGFVETKKLLLLK